MSLILDALNRSRQEHESVPGLGAQHALPTPAPSGWKQRLPWIALGLAGLLIAWLLLERGGEDNSAGAIPSQDVSGAVAQHQRRQERPVAPPAVEQRREPAAPPASNSEKARTKTEIAVPAEPEVAALYAASSAPTGTEESVRPATAQRRAATSSAATAAQQRPVNEDFERQQPAAPAKESTAGAIEEQPVDVEKILRAARDEVANARLVDHPVPFLAALTQQAKDAIPTVLYQRHDYSERSPSVVLNGKTLRVGGSAGSGVKVREILPDSVILEHGGVKFRLRALNSWVNL